MSQNSSSVAAPYPLHVLEHNLSVSDSLFAACNYDLNEVTTAIQPILQAPKRCQEASFFIQAVANGRTTFLATNLVQNQTAEITSIASSWSLGRSLTCAITLSDRSISRCHAVIGYDPMDGFYITDVGSSNGTWVNRRRLILTERQLLHDGDLIRMGAVKIEFFVSYQNPEVCPSTEITYC